MTKHAMLLSVFLLFKFLSKDLIMAGLAAFTIRGIATLSATLSPIKHFLTKECNYKEVVSPTPPIHNFVKAQVAASVPRFFFCMFYAAMKYFLANNVLGISSPIQGVKMLSLRSHKTDAILLDGVNQLMGKVWDWNSMYGTKLKKFDGSVLAANEDSGRCEDATARREDRGDDPKDGSSGPESSADFDYLQHGHRAIQMLAISANIPIAAINGYDGEHGWCIYAHSEGELQEVQDGMVDLVPIGPRELLKTYDNAIDFEIFYYSTARGNHQDEGQGARRIIVQWDIGESSDDDEIAEYTGTYSPGPGRVLEMTYLVIPDAIQTSVKVRLKLKDLGSRSRAVYGKIKANAIDYGNRRIQLFNCDRGRCLSFPSGATSILPLGPSKIALPFSRLLKFHIEVDLTVITTCESHEDDKNLKFSLEFTRGIRSQEREVDDDRVQVDIQYLADY